MEKPLTERGDQESSEADVILASQLKDYAAVGQKLLHQRLMTFAGALALVAFYYDTQIAVMCIVSIALSEVFDFFMFRRILAWSGRGRRIAKRYLRLLLAGAVLSSFTVVYFAVSIALVQGPGAHFMSMFFLLAGGLFAALHNHQILQVLVLRLGIYGTAFLFIPIWDIVQVGANIHSELWAQLFTSLIVLYFVIDCSHSFLAIYRKNQSQLQALELETRRAQEANHAKSEFLATMSHELRTPITSIKGSIDLMNAGLLGPMSDKVASVMFIAQRNCDRLIHLVDETLDLQMIIAGRMALSMERIEVVEFVRATVASNLPYAYRLGVVLSFSPPAEPSFVIGDRVRLEQVLTNILSNAAKFTKEQSTVKISVVIDGNYVRVLVADQGAGLTERDRASVFDPYQRVENPTRRRAGGTGLGMSISDKIMRAHDGKIDYFKNEGAGTTFYMEMKRVRELELASMGLV
jgi:signal transduction histidine kinase